MKLLASTLLILLWSIDRALSQDRCDPGDTTRIRLSAGPRDSKNEGAVQICLLFNQVTYQWFYITADSWTDTDAAVACEELGLHNTAATGMSLTLTNGARTITNTVNCNGDKNRLRDCLPGVTLSSALRQDVAAVVCTCPNGALRLVGGSTNREGRLEVCVDGRWGTVCGPNWGESEAQLVCRLLGLPTINATIQSFDEGTGPIFNCTLDDCTPSTCTHSNDAGVRCLGFDEVCAVTVEQQQSTTTQGTNAPQSATASTNTALAVITALLAAALLAVVIGWIVSCAYWKHSQGESNTHTGMDSPSNERQLDNPVYDGGTSQPHPQTDYSSIAPAYAQVDTNQGTGYDVINRGGAPRPHLHAMPTRPSDQNGDQTYSTLDETAEL